MLEGISKILPSFKNVVPATTELEFRITFAISGITFGKSVEIRVARSEASPVLATSADTKFFEAAANWSPLESKKERFFA